MYVVLLKENLYICSSYPIWSIYPVFELRGVNCTESENSLLVVYASVNSKHQHPPGLTPGEFLKVVKFPAPGWKIFAKLLPRGKKK